MHRTLFLTGLVALCFSAAAFADPDPDSIWTADLDIDPMTDVALSASARSAIVPSLEDQSDTRLVVSCVIATSGTKTLSLFYGTRQAWPERPTAVQLAQARAERQRSYRVRKAQGPSTRDNATVEIRFPDVPLDTLARAQTNLTGSETQASMSQGTEAYTRFVDRIRSSEYLHVRARHDQSFFATDRARTDGSRPHRVEIQQMTSRIDLRGASRSIDQILQHCAPSPGYAAID